MGRGGGREIELLPASRLRETRPARRVEGVAERAQRAWPRRRRLEQQDAPAEERLARERELLAQRREDGAARDLPPLGAGAVGVDEQRPLRRVSERAAPRRSTATRSSGWCGRSKQYWKPLEPTAVKLRPAQS